MPAADWAYSWLLCVRAVMRAFDLFMRVLGPMLITIATCASGLCAMLARFPTPRVHWRCVRVQAYSAS
jgi:hypothetical protein